MLILQKQFERNSNSSFLKIFEKLIKKKFTKYPHIISL